jgi:uncharacterized protein (TIGR00369 family)
MTQDAARIAPEDARQTSDEALTEETRDFARSHHPGCFACREPVRGGLGLRFRTRLDGSVIARFPCASDYQGYPGRLHGGIEAMLLDAAMTHCLFARGIHAVTARLDVRYRRPVGIEKAVWVTARLLRRTRRLCILTAEIVQEGVVCTEAEGRFFEAAGPARS